LCNCRTFWYKQHAFCGKKRLFEANLHGHFTLFTRPFVNFRPPLRGRKGGAVTQALLPVSRARPPGGAQARVPVSRPHHFFAALAA
jgi:hypothetical protein